MIGIRQALSKPAYNCDNLPTSYKEIIEHPRAYVDVGPPTLHIFILM